jgi:hypothetical protein
MSKKYYMSGIVRYCAEDTVEKIIEADNKKEAKELLKFELEYDYADIIKIKLDNFYETSAEASLQVFKEQPWQILSNQVSTKTYR